MSEPPRPPDPQDLSRLGPSGAGDSPETGAARLELERAGQGRVALRLSGPWTLAADPPGPDDVLEQVLEQGGEGLREVAFDTGAVSAWDSALLTFIDGLSRLAGERGARVDQAGLPDDVARLLALAQAGARARQPDPDAGTGPDGSAGPVAGAGNGPAEPGRLRALAVRVGSGTLARLEGARSFATFLGEATLALSRLPLGRARMRARDLWVLVQDCGAGAVGVVSLISLLVGLILALVGAVQLRMFGAEIYVANLVGIAMAREMGAMMTGILMAGRTGAAFAAQLGTMTVNEEVDALRTFGVPPMDFLVLPRVLALVMMMPLLCLYADLMGVVGGALVGIGLLDLAPAAYVRQTLEAVTLADVSQGVAKSVVYGAIVALASCHRGMSSGRSASSVGLATTSAVVTSIIAIIVADAVMVLMIDRLGW